ncbi:TolC family outer membrane protein [Erwinia sp. AnSW2-5]|uniref:TolC family outer membrane protein n=1 Tax=Erwinia sp. AnSW2-5 TaxID=3367692 RepID=UPI00385BA088
MFRALKGSIITLFVLQSIGTVFATTLKDAVGAASSYDSGINSARFSKEAGNEKFDQGVAGLLPNIGIESSYTKQDQPHASYAAAVKRHSYGVNITQPLFDMSKIAALKQGMAISDMADVEFYAAQQKLIVDVSDAYFQVLYQREVLQATRSASQAFGKQLGQAKAALRLGEGTRTDVDEAQANYDAALAKEIANRNDLEVANGLYQRLTGLNADEISQINSSCIRPDISHDLKIVMDEAARNNLDVKTAQLQLKKADADMLGATSAHLPVVSLQGSYGGNWSRGEGENVLDSIFGTTSKTRNTLVGINVSMPIFQGGGQLSQSREALYRREQARDTLLDTQRKVRQEARSAYLGITNGLALLKAQKKAALSAKNKVDSTQYGRDLGLRTIVDELTAQQSYYEAIRAISEARFKYLTSILELFHVTGSLNYEQLSKFDCSDYVKNENRMDETE